VFAVGGEAYRSLKYLKRVGYLTSIDPRPIGHYTARGSDDVAMEAMLLPLELALEGWEASPS
jgi:hypothetical protein